MSLYDDVEREARHDWLDQRPARDAYRRTEAEERQAEDDEAQEYAEQRAEDKPEPEHRA